MEIRPLTPTDHPAAARLAASGYRRLRGASPALPDRWAEPTQFEAELARLVAQGSAWAAIRRGRLIGHMGAFETDWGAGPLSWTPEWAWSVGVARDDGAARRTAIHDLYATAAEGWTAFGARSHWISIYADDRDAADAFTWLGFGHHVVNAIRDLAPLDPRPGIRVRPASVADTTVLQELEDGLRDHLTRPPTLLPLAPARSAEEQRRRIEDPGRAVLLADVGGRVAGHLLVGPVADDVATIVQDPRTASITGAFVRAEDRRTGVAETLLAAAIEWARSGGYERLGVDFESANTLASRFWLRHFTPVTFAMVRRLPAP